MMGSNMRKYGVLCVVCIVLYGSIVYGTFFSVKRASFLPFTYLDPYEQNLDNRLQGPSRSHILGTDSFGRDIFSRLVVAVHNTMLVSVFAVCIATSIGLILAIVAVSLGYVWVYMAEIVIDIILAIPVFLVCLMLVSLYGSGKIFIIIGQCMAFIPLVFRASIQDIHFYMQKEYITIARSFGMSTIHIIVKHIFPFLVPKLLQQLISLISIAISIEAGLSYLGFGIAKPEPSIGNMLYDAKRSVVLAPWYMASVVLTVSLLLVCVQILASRQSKA